jgi:hypothetical protein
MDVYAVIPVSKEAQVRVNVSVALGGNVLAGINSVEVKDSDLDMASSNVSLEGVRSNEVGVSDRLGKSIPVESTVHCSVPGPDS